MPRVCTECGGPLKEDARPDTKTCKPSCRSKRSRRLKRMRSDRGKASAHTPHAAIVAEMVKPHDGREVNETAHEILREELRPVIRSEITEDTLKAIRSMVGLTPRVVELLEQDLESDNDTVRQRAYTLIAKYTLGHQAIVTPESQGQGQQLVVNFALPRPGQAPSETQEQEAPIDVESEETLQCDSCGEDKPLSDMVAGSTRCSACFTQLHTDVRERFGSDL